MDAPVTRAGAADEGGVGRERAANPNSPVFNPQKFPSASGARGTRAVKAALGKTNSRSTRRLPRVRSPARATASAILWTRGPWDKGAPGPGGGRPPAAPCAWLCGRDLPASTCRGLRPATALGPRGPLPPPGLPAFVPCPWPGPGDPEGRWPPACLGHRLPPRGLRGPPPLGGDIYFWW